MRQGKLQSSRRDHAAGGEFGGEFAQAPRALRLSGSPRAVATSSPELLAAALAGMPAFYVADLGGNVLYANAAYLALAERLRGVPVDPDRPPLLAPHSEILGEIETSREPLLREVELAAAAGLQLRVHLAPVHDSSGILTGISGSFEDVRELATARHKLALTNERLDDITRLASDWIWEVDTELAITFVSQRVTEVLGYQPLELIGRSLLELGRFPEPMPGGKHPLDPQRRTPFRNLPFTIAHRDGSQRLFHLSSLPMFCPSRGDFLGFRGTARDVTEEKSAAQRAAQSQNQLSQAIESISEGFSLFDPSDRLVLCNSKFRSSFTRCAATVVPGVSFTELIRAAVESGDIAVPHGAHESWIAERLRLRAQPRVSFELELSNGRWLRVSDHKTADGSIVGIRTDITDLKHREEALYAAKETAEIASRSKSEFLANISHELRTPLNAIIGFSEIMREQIFGPLGSPQYLEYTGDVLDSAHHLLDVINDILDIAKAEAGKLELAEDTVDIASIVAAAMRLVQERAQRGGVRLKSELPPLPPLHADERKLKQILINLLTNAIKFTPVEGSVTVGARLAESGDLLVTVADTGIGIAEKDIATALAPFGQVDSKLNRKYEGTGLGLPLCNAMAKLHGGELAIASVVGKGTTVTIRLPAVRVQAD
jgi:PAS domain S-box-containing protein